MTMLVVHHLGVSQSERVVWLCEELGIPYELVRHAREPSFAAPPAYKAIHPAGMAPTIVDGDVVLAESAAVIEYIIQRHGEGRLALGKDHPDYADYLFWLHFANGTMMPSALVGVAIASLGETPGSYLSAAMIARFDSGCALLDRRLGEHPYLAGDAFSAADIMNVFPLTTLRLFAPRDLSVYPNIQAYLQRIAGRPAYQRAMAKADPGLPRTM
jgi:glutathione S-transferase